jgi:hypothetical protein
MHRSTDMIYVNVLLGTVVVAIGLWLLWDSLSPVALVAWMLAVGGFLRWKAHTLTEVWAWSTLLLGMESFAWPLILLVQLQSVDGQPSEEQMGTVLSAVVLGLFSSVFWVSFSYGLFKRARRASSDSTAQTHRAGLPAEPKRPRTG